MKWLFNLFLLHRYKNVQYSTKKQYNMIGMKEEIFWGEYFLKYGYMGSRKTEMV